MATYAVGDVQGCYKELLALLERIEFDPNRDRLWFTGDLVNRGPQSLEVLRFVMQLGDRAVTVLGNHDLHLLAMAYDHTPQIHKHDTFNQVLAASDREQLLDWLRHRPCLYHDALSGFTLIHAGLPPQWDLVKARQCAMEVEDILREGDHHGFLSNMYGNTPDCWSDDIQGWERLRFITNCLTRMRYCDRNGRIALEETGPPGTQAAGLLPWYEIPGRASSNMRIIFGHWSTLKLSLESMHKHKVFPLDTGCVWGGQLTALRLSDLRFYSVVATLSS